MDGLTLSFLLSRDKCIERNQYNLNIKCTTTKAKKLKNVDVVVGLEVKFIH